MSKYDLMMFIRFRSFNHSVITVIKYFFRSPPPSSQSSQNNRSRRHGSRESLDELGRSDNRFNGQTSNRPIAAIRRSRTPEPYVQRDRGLINYEAEPQGRQRKPKRSADATRRSADNNPFGRESMSPDNSLDSQHMTSLSSNDLSNRRTNMEHNRRSNPEPQNVLNKQALAEHTLRHSQNAPSSKQLFHGSQPSLSQYSPSMANMAAGRPSSRMSEKASSQSNLVILNDQVLPPIAATQARLTMAPPVSTQLASAQPVASQQVF